MHGKFGCILSALEWSAYQWSLGRIASRVRHALLIFDKIYEDDMKLHERIFPQLQSNSLLLQIEYSVASIFLNLLSFDTQESRVLLLTSERSGLSLLGSLSIHCVG